MRSIHHHRPAWGVLCLLLGLAVLIFSLAPLVKDSSSVPAGQTAPTDISLFYSGAKSPASPVDLNIGGLSAQSAVLMDAASGQILYAHHADTPLPMASTTKIMTALCALELANIRDVITVDSAAVGVEGSSVYLKEGEEMSLLDLLYALLLASANDAAAAIAIGTAGSIEAFADYMNDKAAELHLAHTAFENPHGLDSQHHYTTAHDLAIIAKEALSHPLLRTIVSTNQIRLAQTNLSEGRTLVNHNKLLRMYDGAIGVKTGYTKRSGRCLVSAAERDGLTLIAVTLNAPDDWQDHIRLLDAGFSAYQSKLLCDSDSFRELVPVIGGKEDYVVVQNASTVRLTMPYDDIEIHTRIELPRFLYPTVSKGDVIGQLIFWTDANGDGQEETLATVDLCAVYTVFPEKKPNIWQRWFGK